MKQILFSVSTLILALFAFSSCDDADVEGNLTSNSTMIIAGDSSVFFSNDEGNTWTAGTGYGGGTVNDAICVGDVALIGTNSGLYRSSDKGATWNIVSGFTSTVNSLSYFDGQFHMIYQFGMNEPGFSNDGGETWTQNSSINLSPTDLFLVTNGSFLLVFTGDPNGSRTFDGLNWSNHGSPDHSSLFVMNSIFFGANNTGNVLDISQNGTFTGADQTQVGSVLNAENGVFNGSLYFVVTSTGGFAYSEDLTNWTTGATSLGAANDAEYASGNFFVVGSGGGLIKIAESDFSQTTINLGVSDNLKVITECD